MRTTTINHEDGLDGTFTIHHNGDYSGDCKFILPPEAVEHWTAVKDYPGYFVANIPFDVLKHLVGKYIGEQVIASIENTHPETFLDSLIP